MEQTPSSPGRSPELPSVALSPDRERNALSSPEVNPDGALEHQERRSEATPAAEQAPAVPVDPATVASSATTPADDGITTTSAMTSLPTIAGDDDLIEKEWVDRAKKVLVETKDDPYRREQEVTRLQEDYLMKRYGRKLGSLQ